MKFKDIKEGDFITIKMPVGKVDRDGVCVPGSYLTKDELENYFEILAIETPPRSILVGDKVKVTCDKNGNTNTTDPKNEFDVLHVYNEYATIVRTDITTFKPPPVVRKLSDLVHV